MEKRSNLRNVFPYEEVNGWIYCGLFKSIIIRRLIAVAEEEMRSKETEAANKQ